MAMHPISGQVPVKAAAPRRCGEYLLMRSPALWILLAAVLQTAVAQGEDPPELPSVCTVIAMPGEDMRGGEIGGSMWIHTAGVPSHWSEGFPLPVFEGGDPVVFLAASGCAAAAAGKGCRATFSFSGGRHLPSSQNFKPFCSAG